MNRNFFKCNVRSSLIPRIRLICPAHQAVLYRYTVLCCLSAFTITPAVYFQFHHDDVSRHIGPAAHSAIGKWVKTVKPGRTDSTPHTAYSIAICSVVFLCATTPFLRFFQVESPSLKPFSLLFCRPPRAPPIN